MIRTVAYVVVLLLIGTLAIAWSTTATKNRTVYGPVPTSPWSPEQHFKADNTALPPLQRFDDRTSVY